MLQETLIAANGQEKLAKQLLSVFTTQQPNLGPGTGLAQAAHSGQTGPRQPDIGNDVSEEDASDYASESDYVKELKASRPRVKQKRRPSGNL